MDAAKLAMAGAVCMPYPPWPAIQRTLRGGADDRVPIGCECAQPGPGRPDVSQVERCRLVGTLERERYVLGLGAGVDRIARGFVRR